MLQIPVTVFWNQHLDNVLSDDVRVFCTLIRQTLPQDYITDYNAKHAIFSNPDMEDNCYTSPALYE